MALDKKISQAIREAVEDARQPDAVARGLIAWLTAVASGNEDFNDITAAERHLEILYSVTTTKI